jgi:hypothetical protein
MMMQTICAAVTQAVSDTGIFGNREGKVLLDLGVELAGRQKEQHYKERTTVDQLFQGFSK